MVGGLNLSNCNNNIEKYFIVGTFSLTPVLEGAELAASKRLYY